MNTQHHAFKLDIATDYVTLICLQCSEGMPFSTTARVETIEAAKTAHRMRCALKVCSYCKLTIDGEKIDGGHRWDVSHGCCPSCFPAVLEMARLHIARTSELKP